MRYSGTPAFARGRGLSGRLNAFGDYAIPRYGENRLDHTGIRLVTTRKIPHYPECSEGRGACAQRPFRANGDMGKIKRLLRNQQPGARYY
jgi:hypothetical protein